MSALFHRHREDPGPVPGAVAIQHRLLDCFAALAMTVALLLLAAPAAAQTFPELTGRVIDNANLLTPQQEAELAARSAALQEQSGRQFVVATVTSLDGMEIADYSYQLGRHWKIGDEERDDGVVMVVAPNERDVWVATGYGAEGFLPDILIGRIIRNEVLPRFREGQLAAGIMAGADAIITQMTLAPEQARENVAEARAEAAAREEEGGWAVPVIFWAMIAGFVMLAFARRGTGRRYRSHRTGKRRGRGRGFDAGDAAIILWGLSALGRGGRGGWGGGGFGGFGGGGGGFGGFSGGGGSFGGGGAGGSW